MSSSAAALGLDLGSTSFKVGILDGDGRLARQWSCTAPALVRDGPRCEGDPEEYVRAAIDLLDSIDDAPEGLPAGLSCQRSSFVLQDAAGRALSPLISWQDTRAADWCRRNKGFEPEFHEFSGLMLSAHYMGPKLATMAETDSGLADALRAGDVRVRLLDTLLFDRLGGDPSTDPSMAARTGLFDIETLDWSVPLCERFAVHRDCLPAVRPTDGIRCGTPGAATFRASLADQSAGLLALTDADERCVLVNLGTGGFVLRVIGDRPRRLAGYLTGILRANGHQAPGYALEGAIGGSGPAVDRFRMEGTRLRENDSEPRLFAVPDGAGLGAPYWRPEIGLTFSRPRNTIRPSAAHRALLEGLLFRVRDIYDDLGRVDRVVLAGGQSREPFVAQGLATLLGQTIERIDGAEATLCGAAIAASGGTVRAAGQTVTAFEPGAGGAYLPAKYNRWRNWLSTLLD